MTMNYNDIAVNSNALCNAFQLLMPQLTNDKHDHGKRLLRAVMRGGDRAAFPTHDRVAIPPFALSSLQFGDHGLQRREEL